MASIIGSIFQRKVGDIVDKNTLILDESTTIADAARIMRDNGVSSVLVRSKSKEVTGIVTERDILYRVIAESQGPFKVTLGKIMSSPLVTIDENENVKDAIAVMRSKSIRRLAVIRTGKPIGIITLMSIFGNAPDKSVELAEVELPPNMPGKKIACPYCQSGFEDKNELSKHIDRIHLGSGLLEGDLRRW